MPAVLHHFSWTPWDILGKTNHAFHHIVYSNSTNFFCSPMLATRSVLDVEILVACKFHSVPAIPDPVRQSSMCCSTPVVLFKHVLPIVLRLHTHMACIFLVSNAFVENRNKRLETQTGRALINRRTSVEFRHACDRKPSHQFHLALPLWFCLRLRHWFCLELRHILRSTSHLCLRLIAQYFFNACFERICLQLEPVCSRVFCAFHADRLNTSFAISIRHCLGDLFRCSCGRCEFF